MFSGLTTYMGMYIHHAGILGGSRKKIAMQKVKPDEHTLLKCMNHDNTPPCAYEELPLGRKYKSKKCWYKIHSSHLSPIKT